jgi:hypothetical protein
VSEAGARQCVLERGQCDRNKRAWVGDTWAGALQLQVEVWDGLDDTCMLSAEGPMGVSGHPHVLRLVSADRCEVVGPAFSAASRDPVQRRFASIDDYFRRRPDTDDTAFVIKVYVRDEQRGRQALLWSSGDEAEFQCEDVHPLDPLRLHLPEGSRLVEQAHDLPIYSPALPGHAVHASVSFYLCPEAGQEGVAEADKLWRMAGGDEDNYDEQDSFFNICFDEDVSEDLLASLIRGLLDS